MSSPQPNLLQDTGAAGALIASGVTAFLVYRFWKDSSPNLELLDAPTSRPGTINRSAAVNMEPHLNFGPAVEENHHAYLFQQMMDPPPQHRIQDLADEEVDTKSGWNSGHLFILLAGIYLYTNSK